LPPCQSKHSDVASEVAVDGVRNGAREELDRLPGMQAGGGTQMVITVAWTTDDGYEWMLATGTDTGIAAAAGQIDELLALPARAGREATT
jgi:hypothetical protein